MHRGCAADIKRAKPLSPAGGDSMQTHVGPPDGSHGTCPCDEPGLSSCAISSRPQSGQGGACPRVIERAQAPKTTPPKGTSPTTRVRTRTQIPAAPWLRRWVCVQDAPSTQHRQPGPRNCPQALKPAEVLSILEGRKTRDRDVASVESQEITASPSPVPVHTGESETWRSVTGRRCRFLAWMPRAGLLHLPHTVGTSQGSGGQCPQAE